jgi:methylenetetrahydrofolate reductase (NADPH)
MKLIDLWKNAGKPTLSFELFPPRSEKQAEKLPGVIDRLAELKPDFVSVTFGAGGSTREGSRQLVKLLREEKGLEVLAYFAGYGLSPEVITAVLDDYRALGVENVLLVRGDPPREGGFEPHPDGPVHASDLVAYVRPRYDFCIGVAGYPEGHVESAGPQEDLAYLKLKVDQGAGFVVANYFYDNALFFAFRDRCAAAGIEVPILPGVMPIYGIKMMHTLADLCGATITEKVRSGLAGVPEDDKAALREFGVEFALEQCRGLMAAGVPGIHIYTMDRSRSSAEIVNRLRDEGLL